MKIRNANIPKEHGCGGCPFADDEGGEKGCYADYYLDPDNAPLPIRFERYDKYGNSLFPKVPPDWCKLREGPIKVILLN